MKRTALAAGLSLVLHVGVVSLWLREVGPTRLTVGEPRQKPERSQMIRLAKFVSASAPGAPVVGVARARPWRPPTRAAIAAVEGSLPVETFAEAAKADAILGEGNRVSAGSTEGVRLDTAALSGRLQQAALGCYPPAARRFRQTGEAVIRFCLDQRGSLGEVRVIRSTGSPMLDHAAEDCVVPGAAPFGPETLGRCFTVPVRFSP